MNKKTAYLTLSLAGALALVTLALALDVGGISRVVPTAAKAVWGFGGCALALLICGAAALFHKPTDQELVNQSDERNIAIGNLAAKSAFSLFTILMPLITLVLFVLDQISLAGTLTLIAVEVVAFIAYLVQIARIQKTM